MTVAAQTERTRVLAPGARIGRKLEILRPLGEGGMGTLWVARNLTTHAEVAIKVLRARGDDDADADAHMAQRFRHEARLGAMLAHRNITRVFDLLEDEDGSLVLVMELLRGETLQAFCETRRTLPGTEAVAIIAPILRALQYAHEHGVVHRDIKPSNIFLHVDPDGHATPKLLDFGIAKMRDSSIKTRAGDVLGTPSYMSPEQVRASEQIDGRSDLFSVGALLYTIISGDNPFRTDAPSATLARVLELEVDPDPSIEPRLWLEIQRALSKQPYERHASAAALADALCSAVGDAPPPLRPEGAVRIRGDREGAAFRADEPTELRPALFPEPADDVDGAGEVAAALPKRLARLALLAYGAAIALTLVGLALIVAAWSRPKPTSAVMSTTSLPPALVSAPSGEPPLWEVPESAPSARPIGGTSRAPPPRQPWRRPTASPLTPPTASAPPIARTPGF
jgi:hypothetical protein